MFGVNHVEFMVDFVGLVIFVTEVDDRGKLVQKCYRQL